MNLREDKIALGHGNGGEMMHDLINNLFIKYFDNQILNKQTDAAVFPIEPGKLAFTTDSFVIDPLFFPGGNIGKLAVCGTVNDLAVSGAEPCYLSVSFIIEEGLPLKDLEVIVKSLAEEARKANVLIITGDTKVVNRGKCDKLFINTSGIGTVMKKNELISTAKGIVPGDEILINGTIGDHGMAIMNARESFNFKMQIISDCASLNYLIKEILQQSSSVKFMRDPTRGGLSAALNELAKKTNMGIQIDESALPVNNGVRAMCELLGFDPLHIANEGKVMVVSDKQESNLILDIMKRDPLGKNSSIIGEIVADHPGKVVLRTIAGGQRVVDSLAGDLLPRIC